MTDSLIRTARRLRQRQTDDERLLWARLRDRRLNGLKFRRQVPCGPYVADFLCEAARLILELDGSHHGAPEQMEADAARARHLNGLGYRVHRSWNADLKSNAGGVLDEIVAIATRRLSPSSAPAGHLLPKGEGRGGHSSSPGTGEDARRAGEGLGLPAKPMKGAFRQGYQK
jgi:very-short-patch-repair endonuclease